MGSYIVLRSREGMGVYHRELEMAYLIPENLRNCELRETETVSCEFKWDALLLIMVYNFPVEVG